jgi:holo-[acyl-carrier protein] synthase
MPSRVGIDLVEVEDVAESVRVHADRYLERVYTPEELGDCRTPTGVDAERLAARFAAKEATIKVLRPDRGQAVPWNSIGVRRTESGSVDLALTGPAAALAERAGVNEFAVSLTHEAGIAGAVVLAGRANDE